LATLDFIMQKSITERLISILTEAEMENMYEELARILGKHQSQSEIQIKTTRAKDLPEIKAELGGECRKKRERLGLTVYATAKNSGILQNQVKAIEEGQGYNIDALLKLVTALELEVGFVDANYKQ